MAPPSVETKDGLLSDNNSIPLCKIPIEKTKDVSDDYEVESKPFARGKFATVKHCVHKTTRQSYAAKYIKKRRRCQDVTHEILHEARVLLLAAKSDRIVQLEKIYESTHDYILVLELAAGGELQAVLDREEFLPENTSRHVMKQVLEGIAFLHENQIAHLDIKPQNILLTRPLPCCDIKICDFGISRVISKGYDLREIIGTPDYVAPEILNYEPISLATDMWSIGCLTYVVLSGCSPFGGDDKQETFCNITSATLDFPSDVFGEVSANAIDFIKRLIVKEPKKRLSCIEASKHDWLTSGSQKSSVTVNPIVVCLNNNNNNNNNNNHHHEHHSSPQSILPPPCEQTGIEVDTSTTMTTTTVAPVSTTTTTTGPTAQLLLQELRGDQNAADDDDEDDTLSSSSS